MGFRDCFACSWLFSGLRLVDWCTLTCLGGLGWFAGSFWVVWYLLLCAWCWGCECWFWCLGLERLLRGGFGIREGCVGRLCLQWILCRFSGVGCWLLLFRFVSCRLLV